MRGNSGMRAVTVLGLVLALVALSIGNSGAIRESGPSGAPPSRTGLSQFLWVSDLHYDPYYAGELQNFPTFCRNLTQIAANPNLSFDEKLALLTPSPWNNNHNENPILEKRDQLFSDAQFRRNVLESEIERLSTSASASSDSSSKRDFDAVRAQLSELASGISMAPQTQMAKFGRYGCDSPLSLINASIYFMKQKVPKPGFIILGGDFSAHSMPNNDSALSAIRVSTDMIATQYPSVPLFPTIGNNDVFPDYYLGWEADGRPFLQALYDRWQKYFDALGDSTIRQTFLKGGYYTCRVPGDVGGLRIVVLNSIYWSTRHSPPANPLPEDPSDQFKWLSDVLLNALNKREKVLIVTHIPAANNPHDSKPLWQSVYLDKYLEITHKFSGAIVASLFGHLHSDEFRIFSDKSPSNQASGFGMIVPAISPVFATNPGFRRVWYDPVGLSLIDYDEFLMDLWMSNQKQAPIWQQLYSFQSLYGENGISLANFQDLYEQLYFDPFMFQVHAGLRTSLYVQNRYLYYCAMKYPDNDSYNACVQAGNDSGGPTNQPPPQRSEN